MSDRLSPLTYDLVLFESKDVHWEVTRVWIDEALSRPYHAIIDAETDAEHISTDALLGTDAALTLTRGLGSARGLCGLISRLDFLGYDHARVMLRFHLVPALELLRQQVRSRIWQQQSVQDIVAEVLGGLADYGRSFDASGLRRGAEPRDYCVQYRESDFDFVSRLLEEEGISYEFIHPPDSKAELLTLRDTNEHYAMLENVDGSPEVPVISSNPDEADIESIQELEWSKQLTSTAALRADYDWRLPRNVLGAEAPGVDERELERRVYVHGTRRFIADDLGERAEDLRLANSLAAGVVRGRSNVSAMRPGLRFKVMGHYRLDLEREYLITKVIHSGAEDELSADPPLALDPVAPRGPFALEPSAYQNEFECVPYEAVVRPLPLTPKPREYGPQTAIVTGPPEEEIHTDEHGRVQVQFYWQEQRSYGADSSCWVRCSQSWAGVGWGAQFIPRIGMEVIVEFLEGNPDRPLVTGCVYNTEFPPPFVLPEHKTQSGWRTESSPGGGGSNELRFEDAAGQEEIYLHGQKDWTIEIEHDEREQVGHDRHDRVGHDERFEIGHDQSGRVGHDQQLEVGADQHLAVGKNHRQTIAEAKSVDIGKSYELSVGDSMTTRIGETQTTTVGKDRQLDVEGDASERVGGDLVVEATNATTSTSETIKFEAGEGFIVTAKDDIDVDGEAKIVVEAKKKMVFKCGDASITLKQDGKILIKGKDVTVKGSGNVLIKGQKVAEN
jgi:type VI secretion system secreted protein VgrG